MMNEITNLKAMIIDMDGVLWHGSHPIDGVVDFFETLRLINIPFVLATNNASLTQQQYVEKLAKYNVAVTADEVLTSSMATAKYLDDLLAKDQRRAYVIGEEGLKQPLKQHGFELTELYQVNQPDKGINDQGADIVVSGLDRKLTWDKLATATLNIKAGAQFFATNADTTLPTELGEVMGNGGTLAALEAATGVKPVSIGKPEPILYQQALSILGATAEQTVAIGDRLDTDILGAVNAKMRSILVLTGVSKMQDVVLSTYKPTLILESITEVAALLKTLK
jgi:4-nitrophenyl phosphatase